MHELSIAQALVEQVERVVLAEAAVRANRVSIAVGVLSGVEPEALQGSFPLVAEGTVAEGAELVIEKIAARVRCLACGNDAETNGFFIACAVCGSREVEVTAGRELHIQSVELEVGE